MVQSRQMILDSLSRAMPDLRARYGVDRLGLFGSYAREAHTENSDVDILVEVPPTIGLRFMTLARELERLLGRRVDLVSRRAIDPDNWSYISRDLIDVR